MQNSPKLFNLAETLQGEALISDTALPKQTLGEVLGVSRPTVQRYDKIAFWTIQNYKEEYPLLPKEERLRCKCSRDTTLPLTPYQIYILSMIQVLFKHLRTEQAVKNYIHSNSYLFLKSRYENRLVRLAKAAPKTA